MEEKQATIQDEKHLVAVSEGPSVVHGYFISKEKTFDLLNEQPNLGKVHML